MEWNLEDLKKSIIDSAIEHDKIMEDTFIESLKSQGFVYDEDNDRWFRISSKNNGDEINLELYKKQPDGKWKQFFTGRNEDSAFYESII